MNGLQRGGDSGLPEHIHRAQSGAETPAVQLRSFRTDSVGGTLNYGENGETKLPTDPKIDRENYPEVYHETFPEVKTDRNSFPEVAGEDGLQLAGRQARGSRNAWDSKHCGLSRRRLWILVCAIIILIVVAVVGGVVGSGATSRSDSDAVTVLRTTALASVSYKQADATTQYRVYYQADSGELYQSVWTSQTTKWKAAPLRRAGATNASDEPTAKLGTPLSAHIYGSVETDKYEYHLFFLDTSNKIWGLVSDNPDDIWRFSADSALEGNFTAAPNSKLASYGRQCGGSCGNATSIVIWQSDDNKIWLAGYQPGSGWLSFANDAKLEPPIVQGTSISTVSLGADEGLMSIYVNTGSPTELHFNITDGWASNGTLNGSIDDDAAIAALITNYDTANAETADVNVIATRPGSSGGVSLWQDGTLDTSWLNSNAEPPLSSVSNTSAITSNQAGRVYAMEGTRIAEWRWESTNSSYVRVGIVDTYL